MLSELGAKYGRIVPARSVLVTCIAGSVSCIGNAAISDRDVAFNQQINAIVPNNDVDEFFLYFLILNSKKYIQNHSTKALKGIVSKSVFESMPFIAPPSCLQKKFGLLVKEILKIEELQKESGQKIEELYNSMMQRAYKGEIPC
jgi:type I restriction enzyme S subunit